MHWLNGKESIIASWGGCCGFLSPTIVEAIATGRSHSDL
jgi:hypothetical protein